MDLHNRIVKLNCNVKPYVDLTVAFLVIISSVASIISLIIAVRSLDVSKKALDISQKAYDSSETSTDKMIKNLEDLNRLSKDTKEKLSELPQNIEKLNAAVKNISENTRLQSESISKNLFVMEKTIKDFSSTIYGYDKELKNITEAADKQLALLREQQSKLEAEAKRSPDLFFETMNISKTTEGKISFYPGVRNLGNKIAKDVMLIMDLPEEVNVTTNMMKVLGVRYPHYTQYYLQLDIVHAKSSSGVPGRYTKEPMILDTDKYMKDKITIFYYIDEPQKTFSGSLTIDTVSLQVDQSERKVDIK